VNDDKHFEKVKIRLVQKIHKCSEAEARAILAARAHITTKTEEVTTPPSGCWGRGRRGRASGSTRGGQIRIMSAKEFFGM